MMKRVTPVFVVSVKPMTFGRRELLSKERRWSMPGPRVVTMGLVPLRNAMPGSPSEFALEREENGSIMRLDWGDDH
jgi:hypothetical protein